MILNYKMKLTKYTLTKKITMNLWEHQLFQIKINILLMLKEILSQYSIQNLRLLFKNFNQNLKFNKLNFQKMIDTLFYQNHISQNVTDLNH